jgi:acylphosphatase
VPDVIARKVRIFGRVQGVFFRVWACDEARRLGVAGWVRNCADGSVEAHVEGEEGTVEQMTSLLRQGPPHAQVENVEVSDTTPEGGDRFEVRH